VKAARLHGYPERLKLGDGYIDTGLEMTGSHGAEAVVDFVGEKGATADGGAMLRDGGSYYNDLAELMTLQAQGKVTLHTNAYPLDAINDALDDVDNGRVRGRGILVPEAAAA
jgi:NAD+-dependent secondary alcohol dehydrogenase Adh1